MSLNTYGTRPLSWYAEQAPEDLWGEEGEEEETTVEHSINYVCVKCGSMFKHKCRCSYCGGFTKQIRDIPPLEPVTRKCVKVNNNES